MWALRSNLLLVRAKSPGLGPAKKTSLVLMKRGLMLAARLILMMTMRKRRTMRKTHRERRRL
jgi:hypothetical protein